LGANYAGALGNGNDDYDQQSLFPVPVKDPSGDDDLSGVEDIAGGAYHCLGLKDDGTVVAWGEGPLGDRSDEDSSTPVEVYRLGGVEAIAAGYEHSLALKSDGTVWAWGDNNDGQLGYQTDPYTDDIPQPPGLQPAPVMGEDGTRLDKVKQMSGGSRAASGIFAEGGFSLAIKSDGTVLAWGNNDHGALGDGTTTSSVTPVKVHNL
jgi:alpha-tubulin suppressor-like RCC1 family protein